MAIRRTVAEPRSFRFLWVFVAVVVAVVALVGSRRTASGFTQYGVGLGLGGVFPMGHEFITRLAALELLGGDPVVKPDPNDPRNSWTGGKATNTSLRDAGASAEVTRLKAQKYSDLRYQSTYKAVYDAIVGERWVDIGGFDVTKAQISAKVGGYNCWNEVAQEAVDVQYDHFMRRYDDRGAAGGVQAARLSRERFIQYFVAAAMAPQTVMAVWDGGVTSALTEVDRNYFLFGRAVHLFQDSFSPEHTVRLADDNYRRVRQVKSYLCAEGSEQHSHATKAGVDYTSGDVIWNVGTRLPSVEELVASPAGWTTYRPSNMKHIPLVAVEASKDLWAAFIRSMGVPMAQRKDAATAEATRLADTWLSFDEKEMLAWYDDESHRDSTYVLAAGQSGKGKSVSACMSGLDVGMTQQARADQIERNRRICLYNIVSEPGYADLYDPSLRMPFNWQWRAVAWQTPPADWKVADRPSDTGIRVKIKSALNGQYMTAAQIGDDQWIYNKAGEPLEFILVGTKDDGYYRLAKGNLFLSYTAATGAVKLYSSPKDANYRLEPVGANHAIKNIRYNDYMWLSGESPYVTSSGKAQQPSGQWVIEGLP